MPSTRTAVAAGVVGVGLLTVAVRLPLMGMPLDPDEGGYAYIARRWASGERLYSLGAWVDRPQGLMLLFRGVTAVSYTEAAIRVAALLLALVLAAACGAVAWAVAGRRSGFVAAAAAGVLGAGSLVEGYQLNGELAAAAVGVTGLALGWWWRRGSLPDGSLVVAGALSGGALLMKQSAGDTAVVLVALAVSAKAWRPVILAVAGLVLGPLAAVVHAAWTGWSDWWFAVVTFQRTVGASQPIGDRWDLVRHVAWHVAPDLVGAAVVAVVGLVRMRRVRVNAGLPRWPFVVWLVVALVAVVSGPYAHPHYWVQAVAPLAVLVGVATAATSWVVATVLVAVALAVPVALQLMLLPRSADERVTTVQSDPRLLANDDVSAWLRAHSGPNDRVYAFVASADLYLLADRLTGYPYLWQANIEHIDGARPLLARYLSGPDAPRFVVVYQKPKDIDPTGVLAPVLAAHYTKVARVAGYDVLEHV